MAGDGEVIKLLKSNDILRYIRGRIRVKLNKNNMLNVLNHTNGKKDSPHPHIPHYNHPFSIKNRKKKP